MKHNVNQLQLLCTQVTVGHWVRWKTSEQYRLVHTLVTKV